MKIAIPKRENVVDDHFGHCDRYTIFTIHDNKIENVEQLPSPQECGCKRQYCCAFATKRSRDHAGRKYGEWCIVNAQQSWNRCLPGLFWQRYSIDTIIFSK